MVESHHSLSNASMNPFKPFISCVLSFYNEESVLNELIRRLRGMFTEECQKQTIGGYELIFVNDDSTDHSLDVLLVESKKGSDIVVINMSRNFGVSECVLAGMSYAKGDAVIYMDADLQDPPELIPTLIDVWKKGEEVEVVYTTRISRAGEHPLKMFVTKWGYRFIGSIADIELPVDSGDFKLLSRRAVNEVLKLKEKRPYLRGLVSWIGFRQAQIFYHREARYDGRKKTKFPVLGRRTIFSWLDRALISFSDIPLKASLFIGFFVSFVALLYILVVMFQKIMGWYVPGWPALMAAILLLGGVQLMVFGVFGLYLNTIFLDAKNRPLYIVKNVVLPDERTIS
jgi:polyisoprenyl-phosphate glycosyltransferase